MKIPVKKLSYTEVKNRKPWQYRKPPKQSPLARMLIAALSKGELKKVQFQCRDIDMDLLDGKAPALFLMNHSSFLDLEIAGYLLRKRPYHIVCTNDGFVGKEGLMRWVGCIPTRKFITDVKLVKDMHYVIKAYGSSILMYPEASYSFDGTQTPLPDSLGKCVKMLRVPVVMIKTDGAFLRDPLYNALQIRKVKVSATQTLLLTPKQIEEKSAEEINEVLAQAFHYDHFKAQAKMQVKVDEPFRADGLHRVLYKCWRCGSEEGMHGEGIHITCKKCGLTHELTELGTLECVAAENELSKAKFTFVTDWYNWQRECVREELLSNCYRLETDVNIKMLVDSKSIYDVGDGHLIHDENGFHLTGCDGELNFIMKPSAGYSLYADYFWYEIGDVISIGDTKAQYYCFPKQPCNVAKARLATEELYKMTAKRTN